MRSSSGFNRTSYSPPRVYAPTSIPVPQQYASRLPPQTSSYNRPSQVSYPGIIGGTQYLHPQAGLSSIPSSRPLGSSVLTVPTSIPYNNYLDQRPISYQSGSYSPPRVVQAPSIATSTLANQLPPQIQASYKKTNPLDGSYYNPNLFEQSQIQKTMNTTQVVRKFNSTVTNGAQNSDQINEIQLDRIKVYKKANVEKFFGRDVTIDCNYEPFKLFSTKELRGFLVNGFQEFEQNLKKLEQRFSGLESSFYHLLHKGDTPKDIFDRFLVTLDKRVEKFFESFDDSVIQGRGFAAEYFDTTVLRNDYEFWNFRSVVKQGVIEISNKLNDLFVARENSTYYDAQIIRCIETIIKLYSFLKSDLNTILNKSILKCGKILEACTYFYENGEGLKTVNFADFIQLDVASLISQYSDEFDRTYPVLLNKKQIVTEKFHDILKDKSTQNQLDLKQLVRSVFQRERRKLYRTIYNSIVSNGKSELEISEEMLSLNKTITDKMNKIKSRYLTIKNDPLFMEVLSGRMNIEYLKNSPTLFEENSQTVLLLEKFMVNTQQFYEDIKDALSDIIYYKQKESDRNKEVLQGILSKAVYDLNSQEKIIQDKGDMSELILYQFQVLEKSLSSDHSRQNVDTNLESTLMKQLKNNQTNYHLHNVAADLARQEKQKEEQVRAMKENQVQKTKEFSSQIANLMTKPMIDKERNMYPVKDNKYDDYEDDRNYEQSSSLKGLADKLLQTIKQKREEELEKERKLKEEQEEIRYMKEQQYREERERLQLEKQRMIESTSRKFQERREQEQAELQQRIQQKQYDEKERRERELEKQREEDYKKQKQNEDRQKQREDEERQRKARDEDLKRQRDLELKKQKEEDEQKQQLEQERRMQQQAEQEKRKQADLEKKRKAEEEENKRIEEQKKKDQQKKLEQEELKKKMELEEQKRKEEQRIKDEQFRIQQEELKKKKELEEQKRKEEQRIRDEQLRQQQEEQKKRLEDEQKKKQQQKEEEELRKKKIQEEQELKRKEEEEQRKKQQELDRLKKEEEDRIKKMEEQKRRDQEEQDRLKRLEEERLKKEEQKRKEQEEQDRLKKEEEERKKRIKQEEEEENERKRQLEEKQKEEQNKKNQKSSGFNYDDLNSSNHSGSQHKDDFDVDDYDEILGKDNSKNQKANQPSKNTKGFDQDDLYEEIAEDSDNFNDLLGKPNKPAATSASATTNNNQKKLEPIQSKVKNDRFDDFEDLDDNFDDFYDDDLEDKKKISQPPASKTNLPSLQINTKKAEDSKRSNNQNSYEDDFEDFDDFSDKKKKDNQKPAQQPQEQKKSDKKSEFDDFEDIEEDLDGLMGDNSNNKNNKSNNNVSKTNPVSTTAAGTAKPTTQLADLNKNKKQSNMDYDYDVDFDDDDENEIKQEDLQAKPKTEQLPQDKNKKQSNFDYDLDFDDEDDDKQDNLEKDFKDDVEKQPQKNNPPPQKSKQNEYDYEFDEDDEEFQKNENGGGQITQEQMEQMMQAEQEREEENMKLTYDLIQKTNEYVKKTRFGRTNKANLSNYNSYDYVIRLYEEYMQNLQVFLFDYPESMKLLELYEAYVNEQKDLEQLIDEYGAEIQKIYYENTQMVEFAPTTKLYFPLETNSIGFQLIEVNMMNQSVSYFYMVEENEETLIQQLTEFHKFFTYTLRFDEFQASPVKVEDNTLKILQIYEQEQYLQYMCMLFPLVYEFMSDISEIIIDQNTIDRIFYIQLSLENFYTELEQNQQKVTDKFNQMIESYCNHKDFAINIQEYEGFSNEVINQILDDMNQFKEQVLQSQEQKYGLVMFSIATQEVSFSFYFYVAKSSDDKTPHEIGLFCLSMSDQINSTMVEGFDQLQEENVAFRPHVDTPRHNGLYEYSEFTMATWAHLIEKKNLTPFAALNIINFSMIPYYITYKGLD